MKRQIEDVKWDVRKDYVIYTEVYTSRLIHWITSGRIKKGEVVVWRGGLSGWTKPETLPELKVFFAQLESRQRPRKRKKALPRRKKQIRTILVVDDEKDTCFLLKNLLEKKYKVYTATRGREGIRLAGKNKPDLILLDLKLPDIDGVTVLARIRKVCPRSIVTMISAYGEDQVKKEAIRGGAAGFIDKPLYQKKIFKAIRNVMC